MRIKLTSVMVADQERAATFYTEVLGFKETMFMPEAQLAIVHAPDQDVAILLEPSDNPVARAYMEGVYKLNLPIIVMGVPNVQAEYERLRARGVKFLQEPKTDQYGTSAVFDDSCGNYVQLHQD